MGGRRGGSKSEKVKKKERTDGSERKKGKQKKREFFLHFLRDPSDVRRDEVRPLDREPVHLEHP